MTITLLPVYARVRAGLDRFLARHPDDQLAAPLLDRHVRMRRAEARAS